MADGGANNDYVLGNAGDDKITGGFGRDLLIGAKGNDTMTGGTSLLLSGGGGDADGVVGGDGSDVLYGSDGANNIVCDDFGQLQGLISTYASLSALKDELGSKQYVEGSVGGQDIAYGGGGNDKISGGNGSDVLYGEGDNDYLFGDQGNDSLLGGDGTDAIFGVMGLDRIYGEGNNDTIYGGYREGAVFFDDQIRDLIYGGYGDDRYVLSESVAKSKDILFPSGAPPSDRLTLAMWSASDLIEDNDGSNALLLDGEFLSDAHYARYNGSDYLPSSVNYVYSSYFFGSTPTQSYHEFFVTNGDAYFFEPEQLEGDRVRFTPVAVINDFDFEAFGLSYSIFDV